MSFTEKIFGRLAGANLSDSAGGSEPPSYMKLGATVLGIVGSFFAILFGLYNSFSVIFLDIQCMIAGILQMLVGFAVMAIEQPCVPLELAKKIQERALWNRAAFYCIIAIPPIILCPGLGSIFGCGLIFGTGVLYGMMSLGKKASADEMRQAAVHSGLAAPAANVSTNDRAGILKNAQPFSFTGTVDTDSNV